MADSSCMGGCVLSASSLLVASCYTVSQNGVVYTLASPVGQRKTTKKSNPEHRDQGRGRHWKLRPRGACAAVRASYGLCSKHPTGWLPEQLPGEGSWATHLAPLFLRFSASQPLHLLLVHRPLPGLAGLRRCTPAPGPTHGYTPPARPQCKATQAKSKRGETGSIFVCFPLPAMPRPRRQCLASWKPSIVWLSTCCPARVQASEKNGTLRL